MKTTSRLVALDVLRGITIVAMILVNTPGSWNYVYAPLLHAEWHGFTPTDAIFPMFLFIVGISMHFSLKKFTEKQHIKVLKKIIKRASIIFGIGLFLNLFPRFHFDTLRILGVLQRIALAYLIGAILCLYFDKKKLIYITISILLLYWGVLYFLVPVNPYGEHSNLVGKIDLFLLGPKHIWHGLGFPFDPEGFLSTLTAVATVLLGNLTGKFISASKTHLNTVKKLFLYGFILIVIGWLWGHVFPINKSLWTSSYVCFSGGISMVILGMLIWILDIKKITKWSHPFIHFGTNPLFIFVFSGIYARIIIYLVRFTNAQGRSVTGYKYLYSQIFVPLAGHLNGSLLFAIFHILFFWGLVYILYKKRLFIKI